MWIRILLVLATVAALSVGAVVYMTDIAPERPETALAPLDRAGERLRDDLLFHVEHLSLKIGPRNVSKGDTLEQAAGYIENALSSMGYQPQTQEWVLHGKTLRNVWVDVPGTMVLNELVVVAAHYDSYRSSPGADGNGSGVAALLELAERLRGEELHRTVRMLFFVNGEMPWVGTDECGSQRFLEQVTARSERVIGALFLDSVGVYSSEEGSQEFPFPLSLVYPRSGHFLAVFSDTSNRSAVVAFIDKWQTQSRFPVQGGAMPTWFPGSPNSGYTAFLDAGWPAVVLTDTAGHRYADSGTVYDKHSRLDYVALSHIVLSLTRVVADMARMGA